MEIITNAQVTAATGGDELESIEVAVTGDSNRRTLPARSWSRRSGSPPTWGRCGSGDWSCTTTGTSWSTRRCAPTCSGVFAAGDITDYDGKVRLIAVGFGEVATAVNNAAVHLDPGAQLFPGHSTDSSAVPVPA